MLLASGLVMQPYTLEEQLGWTELPTQQELTPDADNADQGMDDTIAALLAEAHKGAGGAAKAPATAAKPAVNLFSNSSPAIATVQGNYRLTAEGSDADVRHIILDVGTVSLPILEGQTIGILAPGEDDKGRPHGPRLYSVSSPRDGERPKTNNLSLTVKREEHGVCSNYVCDLKRGDKVRLTGPFGSTFLLPEDPKTRLLMICTGTGSAPFRGFTMRRQREMPEVSGSMKLFFGARMPDSLPYFGPLKKVPEEFMEKHFAFSRQKDTPKTYVQDLLRSDASAIAPMLTSPDTYIYLCGLKAMESGVESALEDIARGAGLDWKEIRDQMREDGRYHVETY